MAESNKKRFLEYFNRNKKRLLNLLKQQGQFQKYSKEYGYLYSVEIGKLAGQPVKLQVGLKAGELKIIDVFVAA